MAKIYNRGEQKAVRRKLRRNMPRAEVLLWSRIRGSQLESCKFRRQYSVGRYVLDFYAPSVRLAIELDGDSHHGDGAEERDTERQRYIESLGIKIIRFNNVDLFEHLDVVLDQVVERIRSLRKNPPVVPPCARGDVG